MGKEVKTNAMRILDRLKLPYTLNSYECKEFIDGVHIADMLGQDPAQSFKTLVCSGKGGGYYVFVLPVARELDLKKAARAVGAKAVELLPVKEINAVTGYIRGGCTAIGMKKQYPTVIDQSAGEFDRIIISGGRIGSQIFLAPDDFIKATGGSYGDILAEM
ncbi:MULTISPECIES: Cys-tRNA(Pro) deacylase [Ruminococcus]|uniref:Cys-tRNA(Pro)/Cys-tRNA(Cys) deacylase n=1 Tax=Ruminococcus champanellensis (strain DSM 18848 / JCM 17042 / KCTC 15320 / 18P13) TaxID=213810 RepID=D4LD38_RUMC1|nr:MULTISPECIES: Cys-tRNA(Pro) deacylase [Ruminococcus]MED9891269.1 Cys-tRNA(Pro) deacylase [Ruminococcus champanellensis]CBL17533.1 ybaK/ebsC protein [Ruminococcus champanellensis 18P13 = JCM 17042]CDD53019.1 ybaK/ebsC protein [Ruminococcus sp. CAG:379]